MFGGSWEWEECIANVKVLFSAAMSFASGTVRSKMVSGHFLFNAVSGLYLMQQLPRNQERVLSMNMKFFVASGMWMIGVGLF